MNKNVTTVLVMIVILGSAIFFWQKNKNNSAPAQASIKGCYVAHLERDVYTLNIQSEAAGTILGTLAFKNFEKDSSSGTLLGTYKDGILLGDYSFNSEGSHSVREVIFKKQGNSFLEGFGEISVISGRETFTDLNNIAYDPTLTFIFSSTCE